MEIHHKIAGLIIKDRKILVTRKYNEPHFIIPGGRQEQGESAKETLARELKEELDIELLDMRYWSTNQAVHFKDKNKLIHMESYLASTKGEPKATSEINEFIWIDSSYKKQGIKIASIDEDYILPELKKFRLIN
jgi:8-oxo-dGTP pyrophosphatase MutT (NUDIX family)